MTPRSILVADTDEATVEFLVEAVRDEGYTASGVSDGGAATAAILANPPDLVLIDLLFGGMNGLDVLRAVRAWGIEIPMVIMTTNTHQVEVLESLGTVTCLRKPFDLDDLLTCVAKHSRPAL